MESSKLGMCKYDRQGQKMSPKMSMNTRTRVSACTHLYTRVRVCEHEFVHACMHVHVCACVCMHVCVCRYTIAHSALS